MPLFSTVKHTKGRIFARDTTEKRDGREETPYNNKKRDGRETGHGDTKKETTLGKQQI